MPETIREKLADWIDAGVVAGHIRDELQSEAGTATHENGVCPARFVGTGHTSYYWEYNATIIRPR